MNDSSECLSREAEDQLRCVIDAVTSNQKQQSYATAVVFLTFCSSLVFLMQAGFAMICSGCVRKKNVQNTMLKSLLDGTSNKFILCISFIKSHVCVQSAAAVLHSIL